MFACRFAWYHPLQSPEMNFKPGKKRKILDIFGPWVPADHLSLDEVETMPSVMQPASKVLAFDFDPETDEEAPNGQVSIPFHVLDHILDVHKIDFTGLSLSSTKRGNLYRTHKLMLPAA